LDVHAYLVLLRIVWIYDTTKQGNYANMKFRVYLFVLFIVTTIISCTSSPTPTSVPATQSSQPATRQTSLPTIAPTATVDPVLQKSLAGAEEFLPSGSDPLYHLAWFGSASDDYFGGTYLPYRTPEGISILVLGKPRQGCCEWDGKTQQPLWDWRDSGLKPTVWQDIRPVGSGQSSFLGRDADGHWWAVMTRLDWKTSELVVLGIFPVSSLDGRQAETIGLYPAQEMDDLQIERIGLLPEEENVRSLEHFLVREKSHLILYQMENARAREIWSADRSISGRFHVHSSADHAGSMDMTGDGRDEILIVWDLSFPKVIDAYQAVNLESDPMHWLGRFDSTRQYTDVTGDGVPEFLQPDNPEDPQKWQVTGWDGNTYAQRETLPRPQAISPPAAIIRDPESLPALPGTLVFQRSGNYEQWWRLAPRGDLPDEMSKPPSHLFDDCAPNWNGGYGEACYSPAGRFKLVQVPAYIEGASTGILDGVTNNRVTVPDSFVYTDGYNTFAWSPDERFLLFARGDGVAGLAKVDPVDGASQTVLDSSLCGLDIWHCTRRGLEGFTDPIVFADGTLGFAFQSNSPSLYPPPGIYRLSPQAELTMLAALPFIDESKGIGPDMPDSAPIYGYLLWSPDKSMFLFRDLFVGNKTGIRTLLLGRVDGSALWDLREVFPDVNEFRWER
jgi:hypothetical protein